MSSIAMKNLFRKKIDFIKSHPKLDILFLLIALGIFATITLINAPRASIWFDEAFSSYISQFSFAQIAHYTALDVHPPLYYWVLKLWEMLFGTSALALRSLSIFFGGATIVVAYAFARRQFGRLVAAVTLLFLTLSPMFIRYSDEGRMYTLAALIALGATYLLVKATETNRRRTWVLYGILVGLGMWTHYLIAFIWISHWVWRAIITRQSTIKWKTFWPKFFTKNWVIAHVVAIAVFLPWVPAMLYQLGVIQVAGFWIGPVGPDSFSNYFTNLFLYLDHGQVFGWLAVVMLSILLLLAVLAVKVYRSFNKAEKQKYLLVVVLSFAPVIIMFLSSLPPLRPDFVERYALVGMIAFTLFAAVTILVGSRKWHPILRALPIVAIAGMMIYGVTNVYLYGNYNKNSDTHILTHEVIEGIDAKAKPGEPIIANTPWIFYEAVFYTTSDHPVYFIDSQTQYIYGSLEMLRTNDQHKIKDLTAFTKEHPTVWYIGNSSQDLVPPVSSWKEVDSVTTKSPINGSTNYRAAEFKTN
jgi:uncharacterized membrane protein